VVYWATAPVPLAVTAVVASRLAVALGVGPLRVVGRRLRRSRHPALRRRFVLAAALQESGLDWRFASALLRQRWATGTPARLLAVVGIVMCALSLWISNTATTALMLPIGQGLLRSIRIRHREPEAWGR
jgi:solute carrier family 13 (sodium-dependent dicarboxylate transporter), member 2/3/5